MSIASEIKKREADYKQLCLEARARAIRAMIEKEGIEMVLAKLVSDTTMFKIRTAGDPTADDDSDELYLGN